MPKELEECVEKLMADPDFKPEDGEDKNLPLMLYVQQGWKSQMYKKKKKKC